MNPLRANPHHELNLVGKGPRLFEQEIDTPLRRVTPEKWSNASLEFQPVLYRRDLDRNSGTGARLTVCQTVVGSRSQLEDSLIFPLNRLRKRASRANGQKCYE